MKKQVLAFGTLAVAASAAFAVPQVSEVTWSQPGGVGKVTISYKLTGAPAVVTLDILTNATVAAEGVSIGAEHFRNAQGAVNKYLAEDDTYTITWKPSKAWPGQVVTDDSARAKVTAWDPAHPPAYMVVDLSSSCAQRVAYYECAQAIPEGLAADVYRTSKMVFRKIDAEGECYTFGSQSELGRSSANVCGSVTMAADYYLGVFEVTKAQWALVCSSRANGFGVEASMRPQSGVSYVNLRCNSHDSSDWGTSGGTTDARKPPVATSFMGRMRTLVGLDVDLPTESQWEFAARATHGAGYWGNGTPMLGVTTCANLDKIERYAGNGGVPGEGDENYGKEQTEWTTSAGSAKVGTYGANDFGLYDMHGNVSEICRDFWCTTGNSDVIKGLQSEEGFYYTDKDDTCVVRGGGWKSAASICSSSQRTNLKIKRSDWGGAAMDDVGFRVYAPAVAVK